MLLSVVVVVVVIVVIAIAIEAVVVVVVVTLLVPGSQVSSEWVVKGPGNNSPTLTILLEIFKLLKVRPADVKMDGQTDGQTDTRTV